MFGHVSRHSAKKVNQPGNKLTPCAFFRTYVLVSWNRAT
eukprot:SAG31_NODE_40011_length_284_cov_0.394595_1_plen_38_part_10